MNQKSVREYLEWQMERYLKAGRKEKGKILDDVEALTGYHRKSAIRALSGHTRERKGGRVGRPVEYGPEVAAAVRVVHEAAGGIGARRLHPFVGELASRLAEFGELQIDASTEAQLRRASAATLERMVAGHQLAVSVARRQASQRSVVYASDPGKKSFAYPGPYSNSV